MSVTQEHGSRPSAGSWSRRRPREDAPPSRLVQFKLTEEDFAELEEAAGRAHLAKGGVRGRTYVRFGLESAL